MVIRDCDAKSAKHDGAFARGGTTSCNGFWYSLVTALPGKDEDILSLFSGSEDDSRSFVATFTALT